jgi:uncharacterized SAM-binding protein YcdF (DUF218 family)
MGWLRGALAAIGVSLAAIAALALLIDREGVTTRDMYRVDGPDVLVVLGARVEADETASPVLAARVKHAVGMLKPGGLILFSGGVGTYGPSEASVARDLAVKLGVQPQQCLLEEESHSTLQNAAFSIHLLRKKLPPGAHVILVSDPYHLPRARRLFERLSGNTVSTSPVLDAPRHLDWVERIKWTLREVPALAKDLVLTR